LKLRALKALQKVFGHAAQSSGTGDRDAFALDQSLAQAVGTRSDRGQCAQVRRSGKAARRTIGWMRRHWRGWLGLIPSCCIGWSLAVRRMPYERRSQFSGHFLSPDFGAFTRKPDFFTSTGNSAQNPCSGCSPFQ